MAVPPPRSSAVLLLLFQRGGEDWLILTRRSHEVATHKGHISLPGGVREDYDESLLHTALRETREELGIPEEQIEVLGRLEDVFTVVSNFNITPFVARLGYVPSYVTDAREVAEVIEMPLSHLRTADLFWSEEIAGTEGHREVYFFRYGENVVWGATAKILKQFLDASIPGTL